MCLLFCVLLGALFFFLSKACIAGLWRWWHCSKNPPHSQIVHALQITNNTKYIFLLGLGWKWTWVTPSPEVSVLTNRPHTNACPMWTESKHTNVVYQHCKNTIGYRYNCSGCFIEIFCVGWLKAIGRKMHKVHIRKLHISLKFRLRENWFPDPRFYYYLMLFFMGHFGGWWTPEKKLERCHADFAWKQCYSFGYYL